MTELTPLEARQLEVENYALNIAKYKSILETLDGNWDEDLIQFENMDPHDAARQCSLERLDRLAELQLHKQIGNLLRTETVEHFKARAILNTMI